MGIGQLPISNLWSNYPGTRIEFLPPNHFYAAPRLNGISWKVLTVDLIWDCLWIALGWMQAQLLFLHPRFACQSPSECFLLSHFILHQMSTLPADGVLGASGHLAHLPARMARGIGTASVIRPHPDTVPNFARFVVFKLLFISRSVRAGDLLCVLNLKHSIHNTPYFKSSVVLCCGCCFHTFKVALQFCIECHSLFMLLHKISPTQHSSHIHEMPLKRPLVNGLWAHKSIRRVAGTEKLLWTFHVYLLSINCLLNNCTESQDH